MAPRTSTVTRRDVAALVGGVIAALALPGMAHAAPIDVGQWSPVYPLPDVPIHAHVLPNGSVLIYPDDGGTYEPTRDNTVAYVIGVPADGAPSGSSAVPNDRTNLFCAGHTFLSNGQLLVIGGQKAEYYRGVATTTIFNWSGGYGWQTPDGANMRAARWYPTAARLASGDVVAVGGTIEQGVQNKIPEVWSGGKWRALTSASLTTPYYPWIFQDPKNSGRVLMAGPRGPARYLAVGGTGKWTLAPKRLRDDRSQGVAVLYDVGRILAVGGGGSNTAETINLLAASPAWKATGSMKFARRYHHATVLFDGKVLVTGGGADQSTVSEAVHTAELWDPATGRWSLMAAAKNPRLYHSVGFLLPDGRVVSAGGGRSRAPDFKDMEMYSPPYLFIEGPRPTITSVPGQITYGQAFSLQTPDAASIGKVSLVGLSSVTHSFNAGQRFLPLRFTLEAGVLRVVAPANANHAPPGHYMLAVVNKLGKPSIAKIIRIL